MKHHKFNSKEEYLKWVKTVRVGTDGLARGGGIDEQLIYDLKNDVPVRFPCITVNYFEASFDRFGDSKILLWEHIYLAEFTEDFNPYKEQDRIEVEEKLIEPYFIALQEVIRTEEHWRRECYGPLTEKKSAQLAKMDNNVKRLNKKYEKQIDDYFIRKCGYDRKKASK